VVWHIAAEHTSFTLWIASVSLAIAAGMGVAVGIVTGVWRGTLIHTSSPAASVKDW
jgi:ABC-type dipeptide/oligopeptide/nickel transport system permease component